MKPMSYSFCKGHIILKATSTLGGFLGKPWICWRHETFPDLLFLGSTVIVYCYWVLAWLPQAKVFVFLRNMAFLITISLLSESLKLCWLHAWEVVYYSLHFFIHVFVSSLCFIFCIQDQRWGILVWITFCAVAAFHEADFLRKKDEADLMALNMECL